MLVKRVAEAAGRKVDSIARAAMEYCNQPIPSPEASVPILKAMQHLAADDNDMATLRNGVGFSKVDSYHGHELASRMQLTDDEALVGRALVRRYAGQLPVEMVAAALDEAAPVRPMITEKPSADHARDGDSPVGVVGQRAYEAAAFAYEDDLPRVVFTNEDERIPIMTPEIFFEMFGYHGGEVIMDDPEPEEAAVPAAPKRGRGRPTNASQGLRVLTQVERNRRYRAAKRTRVVSMPGAAAKQFREARWEHGMTTEQLIAHSDDSSHRFRSKPATCS